MQGYIIENLTNMHVGSGDINFGVVDNLVQKDPISGIPVIHASSIKGAMREFFEERLDKDIITYIFGQDPDNSSDKKPGAYSFFEARLLTRPVRSNIKIFFNVTSTDIIKQFLEYTDFISIDNRLKEALIELSQIESDKILIFDEYEDAYIEDQKVEYKKFDKYKIEKKFLGDVALCPHNKFLEIDLPFIARNKLNDDGTSNNLWYEEIVPRNTKFYFFIKKPTNKMEKYKTKIEEFDRNFKEFISKNELIQFGANKSIGYGFCRLKEIK